MGCHLPAHKKLVSYHQLHKSTPAVANQNGLSFASPVFSFVGNLTAQPISLKCLLIIAWVWYFGKVETDGIKNNK